MRCWSWGYYCLNPFFFLFSGFNLQVEKGLAEAPSKLQSLVDPSTRGTFAYESLKTAAEMAINCLKKESRTRPSIEDVLWNLQYSIQIQEGWTSTSGNLGGPHLSSY